MSNKIAFIIALSSIVLASLAFFKEESEPVYKVDIDQAKVIQCAKAIHALEQEVDMLRLRIEELEEAKNQ